MTSEIRAAVERRYRREMPTAWSALEREDFLNRRTSELQAQVQRHTETLADHNLAEHRRTMQREPTFNEVIGLRKNSRTQAIEIALHQLWEGHHEEPSPQDEPDPWTREQEIGNALEKIWQAKPPLDRWATAWSTDPDDPQINLAYKLWDGCHINLIFAAAHLLQAMLDEGLPLPEHAGDPVHQWTQQQLHLGLQAENQRRAELGLQPTRYSD